MTPAYHIYARYAGDTYYLVSDTSDKNIRHFVAIFRQIYAKATIEVSSVKPNQPRGFKMRPGFHEFFTAYTRGECNVMTVELEVRRDVRTRT